MEKELKIGIIGCGAIGRDHCRRIMQTVPGATVVAVADYVAAAADDTAARFGIRSFGNDCDGLIKDPEVEAVMITSIDATHHDYVMKVLAQEKWCFCEKPLSQNAADCEEIIARELQIGKRLVQVGFMRRYDRGYAEMKRIIQSGELGAPLLIKACHRNVSQGPGFKTENGITNVAIHELDICRWLLDDEYEDAQAVRVRQSANSTKGYDNPQVVLLRTKKGCFIDVEVQVADGYGYDIQCEVVCENGTVKLPDPYAVVRRSRPQGWDSLNPAESMPIMTDWKERFIEAYDIEMCRWVESVHQGKLTGPSAWDGYVACVAGDALNASRGTSRFLPVATIEKPALYK
ncbi:MAG: Gfo/Idh/MocA family oxidoreductase [Firmicutes bacterium]|nr:Gfo/Idh/MocA family oxidoreductase [Bacillota bacterium]